MYGTIRNGLIIVRNDLKRIDYCTERFETD